MWPAAFFYWEKLSFGEPLFFSLIIWNKRKMASDSNRPSHIHAQVGRNPVTPIPKIWILWLWVQQETHNHEVISWLQTTSRQLNNIHRRVSSRRHGVKEKEAHQLIQAFLISRIAYVCPHLHLREVDLDKTNILICTVYNINRPLNCQNGSTAIGC